MGRRTCLPLARRQDNGHRREESFWPVYSSHYGPLAIDIHRTEGTDRSNQRIDDRVTFEITRIMYAGADDFK